MTDIVRVNTNILFPQPPLRTISCNCFHSCHFIFQFISCRLPCATRKRGTCLDVAQARWGPVGRQVGPGWERRARGQDGCVSGLIEARVRTDSALVVCRNYYVKFAAKTRRLAGVFIAVCRSGAPPEKRVVKMNRTGQNQSAVCVISLTVPDSGYYMLRKYFYFILNLWGPVVINHDTQLSTNQ